MDRPEGHQRPRRHPRRGRYLADDLLLAVLRLEVVDRLDAAAGDDAVAAVRPVDLLADSQRGARVLRQLRGEQRHHVEGAPQDMGLARGEGLAGLDRVVDDLPEKVYLTIDLDGLDPSVLPGTGTPEPGGLSYRQLVKLIKTVGQKRRVVAADITELTKIKGSHVSEFTAAKIATKIFVHCL